MEGISQIAGEISQIAACISRLKRYSERCDNTTASTIRKIMKILLKYVTGKHRRGSNPINQNHRNKLDIYITRIQNDIPADILFSVQEAATTIQDDQSHDNVMRLHSALNLSQHMVSQHTDNMMRQHTDNMMRQHTDNMMDQHIMDQHMMRQHMMALHVHNHHLMDQHVMPSNDDCEQYAKLLKEINSIESDQEDQEDILFNRSEHRDAMIRNNLSEIETKYTNLRHESNNIRIKLNELELEPTENAEHIYNLVARLKLITEQTSKFEKLNGGGAGKF